MKKAGDSVATSHALRCYQCSSGVSWADCKATTREVDCEIQGEQACLSVYAEGTLSSAYIRECFYNDKTMCNLIQDELPETIRLVDCDLCTTELCNDSSGSVVIPNLLLIVVLYFVCGL
uniref:UPAR/Ly6 domain-containing protein n=1 Tax=Anopheles dirus TaxID=7168 RepID=A0A182NRB8_9DIPT